MPPTALISFFFDSATLVLIWMVQLVVYPSFAFYDLNDLKQWHQRYTRNISLIVIPLMFGQLVITFYSALWETSMLTIVKLLLVCSVWVLTFIIFVPLHNALASANIQKNQIICQNLVKKNWSRTFVWTIIFVLGLFQIATVDLF